MLTNFRIIVRYRLYALSRQVTLFNRHKLNINTCGTGQVAVNFFILKNIFSIMIAAIVIAVCAVNVALFVFFKLREQWENQWYKRLACAMLLGGAACGTIHFHQFKIFIG